MKNIFAIMVLTVFAVGFFGFYQPVRAVGDDGFDGLAGFGVDDKTETGTGLGTAGTGDGVDLPTPDGVDLPTPESGSGDGGTAFNVNLINPLRSDIDTFPELVAEIIRILVLIAVPVITLAIIYAGFLFVAAQGNSEKLSEARKTLIGVMIGAAIVLGAYVLAEAIGGTVEELGSDPTVDVGVKPGTGEAGFGVE